MGRTSALWCCLAVAVCCGLGAGVRSHASEGGAGSRIVGGTEVPESQFPTVGRVGDATGTFCTGTLIAPRFVLGTAHCFADNNGNKNVADNAIRFILLGQTYNSVKVTIHPTYRGDQVPSGEGSLDLAIIELDREVVGVTPTPLYRQEPTVGQVMTLAGYGLVGTGETGVNDNGPVPPDGAIQFGRTPIDKVTPTFVAWNFEDKPAPNNEANTAPGDSGGPSFIDVNGTLFLAGVTSFGLQDNAGFGDESFNTRVDIALAFIDSIAGTSGTGGGGGGGGGTGGLALTGTPTATPNPATLGQAVTFTAAANVTGATFSWNFGDGTPSESGASVTHSFSQEKAYTVVVTVTDPATGATVTGTVIVDVGGFNGDAPGSKVTVLATRKKFKLDFRRFDRDSLDITFVSFNDFGFLNAPDFDSEVGGNLIEILIGNRSIDSLEMFGNRGFGNFGSLRWNARKGEVRYSGKGLNLENIMALYGARNEEANKSVTVPIFMRIDSVLYGDNYLFFYKSRTDRGGQGK